MLCRQHAHSFFQIVRMNKLHPSPLFQLIEAESGKFHPLSVKVYGLSTRAGGENLLGHRFRHEVEPLALLFHRVQRRLPAGQGLLQLTIP